MEGEDDFYDTIKEEMAFKSRQENNEQNRIGNSVLNKIFADLDL